MSQSTALDFPEQDQVGWKRALYAFLVEKKRRSESDHIDHGYSSVCPGGSAGLERLASHAPSPGDPLDNYQPAGLPDRAIILVMVPTGRRQRGHDLREFLASRVRCLRSLRSLRVETRHRVSLSISSVGSRSKPSASSRSANSSGPKPAVFCGMAGARIRPWRRTRALGPRRSGARG